MKESLATASEPLVDVNVAASFSPKDFFISLRPDQWTKNLVIFAPLVFADRLGDPRAIFLSILAFIDFCFLSGAVYLVNDVFDYEQDRFHPVKRNRPIASGRLGRNVAMVGGILLYAASLGAAYLLDLGFFQIALLYTLVTVTYTYYFKKIAILDVMTISIGFVLRAIAGSRVIDAEASFWFLLCTFLLALFLALSKRRHELVALSGDAVKHRTNLAQYSPYLLDQMIGVVTASCVIAYTLYTYSDETVRKFHTDKLSFTVPFVIFGIFRYLYLIHQEMGGGIPSKHLVSDKPLLISIVLWVLTCILIIYYPQIRGMF